MLRTARCSNRSKEMVEGEGRTLLDVLPLELPPPRISPRISPLAEADRTPRGVRPGAAPALPSPSRAARPPHAAPPAARPAAPPAATPAAPPPVASDGIGKCSSVCATPLGASGMINTRGCAGGGAAVALAAVALAAF